VAAAEAAAKGQAHSASAERAVLVSVEFTAERRRLTSAARQARKASLVAASSHEAAAGNVMDRDDFAAVAEPASDLDFDAALAEFQELARSAGAVIAATLIQRRARPDAATLVGQGKLDEIEAVVANNLKCTMLRIKKKKK